MYTEKMQCKLTTNSKTAIFSTNPTKNSHIDINSLTINMIYKNNSIDISIFNNSQESVNLNKFELELMNISYYEYSSCIIHDEFHINQINTCNFNNIKGKENYSYLYSVLFSENESNCKLVGFLSSHSCRNYVKFSTKENSSIIYAVYDFINHKLEPKTTLILDSIYINEATAYSQLLNEYTYNISNKLIIGNDSNKENNSNKAVENNLLFTDTAINETLRKNKNLASIKLNKKIAYLIDISSPKGKDIILEKCNNLINNNINVIHIKNIMPYIKIILDLKCFNVYYEINILFKFLKASIKDICFIFDDCPLGLALGNLDIINNSINFIETTNLFKKLIKKEPTSSLNYDFIIKTLLENSIFKHNTIFNINNDKMKEILEVISMNSNLSKQYDTTLSNTFNDFDSTYPVTLTSKSKEVFSLLRLGKNSIYIAVFNLSNISSNFFLDLSLKGQCKVKNGLATDILSNKDYLISDNKIYIKNIHPMECLLIKKDLNKDQALQETI